MDDLLADSSWVFRSVTQFLGALLVIIGPPAGVTYLLARWLGQRWIDHQLNRRIESFKADQARELEKLRSTQAEKLEELRARQAEQLEAARHRFNLALRRSSKLHDREFDVLADCWQRLNEALATTGRLVSSYQEYPDLNQLTPERLTHFLANSRLSEPDRNEVGKAPDKTGFYKDVIFWYWLGDAKRASSELHSYVARNSIFLPPDLRAEFMAINDVIWDAIVGREVGHQVDDHKMWIDATKKMSKEIAPMKERIERVAQTYLGYEMPDPKSDDGKSAPLAGTN